MSKRFLSTIALAAATMSLAACHGMGRDGPWGSSNAGSGASNRSIGTSGAGAPGGMDNNMPDRATPDSGPSLPSAASPGGE